MFEGFTQWVKVFDKGEYTVYEGWERDTEGKSYPLPMRKVPDSLKNLLRKRLGRDIFRGWVDPDVMAFWRENCELESYRLILSRFPHLTAKDATFKHGRVTVKRS